MARTKGARGRSPGDTVRELRERVTARCQEKGLEGCRVCGSPGEVVSVPKRGDKPSVSRLPYLKGMTREELDHRMEREYTWACRECLKGGLYPQEWKADHESEGKVLDLLDQVDAAALNGDLLLKGLLRGEWDEIIAGPTTRYVKVRD